MAYKDTDKQKQANKEAMRRYRKAEKGRKQGITKGITDEGITDDVTPNIGKPLNYGQPDCQCLHCQQNRHNGNKHLINHGEHKRVDQLGTNEVNRVSLPGDADYEGVATGLLTQQAQG